MNYNTINNFSQKSEYRVRYRNSLLLLSFLFCDKMKVFRDLKDMVLKIIGHWYKSTFMVDFEK